VYDVTAGRQYYGPDGGYHIFAGRDSTRSFFNGCFEDSKASFDLRGLSDEDMKLLKTWIEFYSTHKDYFYVGRVILPEIDANSPIPNDKC
jgi:hypothetical protein